MDVKFPEHSKWINEEIEDEKERQNLFSEWFSLFGANKKLIVERMPLFIRKKRGSKKTDTSYDTSMGFRVNSQHRAKVDKICLTFRSKGQRIFETDADFNRTASEFFAAMIFNIIDEKEALDNNIDIKFMDKLDYFHRSQNKIKDGISVLESYAKMLKNEMVSEEDFLKTVEEVRKHIPKSFKNDFNETIKDRIHGQLGVYGKRLISGLKAVK